MTPTPPLLGFVAFSGTGKTTLLVQLIPQLGKLGLRVGVIKHAHHSFDIDQPGKDSFRLRQAGASPVMVVSSKRRAIVYEYPEQGEIGLFAQLPFLVASELDLILVEGFKAEPIPKIELHRPALGQPLLYPHDPHIIAVASDVQFSCPLPWLDLNQPEAIAQFIVHDFLGC
ncbi:MAG: molybdopterin-guanine dinucleotide biosynthesis protein B [Methylohalobius sp.]|nr:molybdopterin-guanine dinucleotide biosynthesis protein B [Methylohalobius sp.]